MSCVDSSVGWREESSIDSSGEEHASYPIVTRIMSEATGSLEAAIVSVIIPMRNEKQHIRPCLQSVVDQDYPKHLMEVLVVDGMSEDLSGEVVEEFARANPFIRLLRNPKRSTAAALNKGIAVSKGQVIIRMDAHCLFSRDYVRRCIEVLEETGAENVGGFVIPLGTNSMQKTIALCMSSSFGIGTGRFHYRKKGMFVDTVSFGAYRRQIFDQIGFYDENAFYGEDDELNYRIIKSGGKIFLSPKIQSKYYPRASLPALWRQYYNYGRGKVRTIKKHGAPASWRHLVPAAFVMSIITSLILSAMHSSFWWATVGICGIYLLSATIVSAITSLREGWIYFPALPVVFATLHISYGIGFLSGVWRSCCIEKIWEWITKWK